ncbi:MAG TPA: HAD-IIA family hydrolase [Candidatus Hydrogenedentes bacterium]|jgi:NagD protein|nr:MAG: Ribonucleotide monophosphatase NagD [Candidatus Hydrogenedentes bacterium ADurb.Bin170]HNZ47283.1 HAD-IIA family hydrolase [Candidatus Hydrogenedentota bacterium]HOH41487.1 HAD-IIA family hydrolase [Candidatus Hydrogenedentota bacterium]HPX85912.1 HAD-IIA family hydrolase [Candidatus Hydrogenedentota bacterium]HQB03101.1 HAD-IIA family hydrolase [Candidatus Hydrogenedentota bacterium]
MDSPKNYLIDMDGVLVKGRLPVPGAQAFVNRLKEKEAKFLVLTNNPMFSPADLAYRLRASGLDIPVENIFTSAMATAQFLHGQRPYGTAFVIGESGLTSALHGIGYIITDHHPDYVVLGETMAYNLEQITKAVRLVAEGSRFIATNPDASGPTESGIVPACGAMAALIEKATGRAPFFVGKPAPFMMRSAMNYLGVHSQNTVMVGDRMDTDIIAGMQAGMETILVLSGVTRREELSAFPFMPTQVLESVADIKV